MLRVAGLFRTEANKNPAENLLWPPAVLPSVTCLSGGRYPQKARGNQTVRDS